MKPAAADHLRRAQEALLEAEKIAAIRLPKVAARSAYFAAFHAAEALIVERTGKIAKTHSCVRTEFARLTSRAPKADRPLLSFLAKGYKYKESSDYAVGSEAAVTLSEATAGIDTARRFVAYVTVLIDRPLATD